MSQIEIRVRFNLMMKDGHHCFLMDVDCGAEDVMAKIRHGGKTPRRRQGAKTPWRENATDADRCPEKARPCMAQKRHGEKTPRLKTDVQRRQGRVWRKNATARKRHG